MAINIDLIKTQQYLDWLKDKLYLNSKAESAKNRKIYRGQIYRCKLGIGIGSEECKERPCVIFSARRRRNPRIIPEAAYRQIRLSGAPQC